jgi:hypothetical protein
MSEQLIELLSVESLDMDAVGAAFDAAEPQERLDIVRSLGKNIQRKLFEACEGRGGLTMEAMVPVDAEPLTEVIHEGRNSLPMFNFFQKRMCRVPESERFAGYNQQSMMWATGPGYFVTRPADDVEGEVDIDYGLLPDQKVESWPEIVPQDVKLGRFVYKNMVDRLRRVSQHVTIGRAIIGGKETHNYFLLCRQD